MVALEAGVMIAVIEVAREITMIGIEGMSEQVLAGATEAAIETGQIEKDASEKV